jgi:hypothetical protein
VAVGRKEPTRGRRQPEEEDGTHLAGEGDDAACRGVAGGDEATTLQEMGTMWLDAVSPTEVSP